MKRILFCLLAAALTALSAVAAPSRSKTTSFHSPDGTITVGLTTGKGAVSFTVLKDGKAAFTLEDIRLDIGTESFPSGAVKVGKPRHMAGSFQPVVPLKFATVHEDYNEITLTLAKGVTLLLRVMDNGVAYRFVLDRKEEVEVFDDHFRFVPADGFTAHYQTAESFNTSCEEPYRSGSLAGWSASDRPTATIPLLLSRDSDDTQLLIGESDVDDYPKQFLKSDGTAILPTYPKSPLRWIPEGDRDEKIVEEAPYIARTAGRRAFPWRWVAVTDSKGIIEQTLPAQLARRNVLEDVSWIHPGQFSWEWWNGAAPYGPDVDFEAGCNLATY